jgi:hypothetical protein
MNHQSQTIQPCARGLKTFENLCGRIDKNY